MLGVLVIGAIYAFIPIVIIIILIAAAVGLSRGSDIFALFGIGTLIGLKGTIGTGSTGKGLTRGPTMVKLHAFRLKEKGKDAGRHLKKAVPPAAVKARIPITKEAAERRAQIASQINKEKGLVAAGAVAGGAAVAAGVAASSPTGAIFGANAGGASSSSGSAPGRAGTVHLVTMGPSGPISSRSEVQPKEPGILSGKITSPNKEGYTPKVYDPITHEKVPGEPRPKVQVQLPGVGVPGRSANRFAVWVNSYRKPTGRVTEEGPNKGMIERGVDRDVQIRAVRTSRAGRFAESIGNRARVRSGQVRQEALQVREARAADSKNKEIIRNYKKNHSFLEYQRLKGRMATESRNAQRAGRLRGERDEYLEKYGASLGPEGRAKASNYYDSLERAEAARREYRRNTSIFDRLAPGGARGPELDRYVAAKKQLPSRRTIRRELMSEREKQRLVDAKLKYGSAAANKAWEKARTKYPKSVKRRKKLFEKELEKANAEKRARKKTKFKNPVTGKEEEFAD